MVGLIKYLFSLLSDIQLIIKWSGMEEDHEYTSFHEMGLDDRVLKVTKEVR